MASFFTVACFTSFCLSQAVASDSTEPVAEGLSLIQRTAVIKRGKAAATAAAEAAAAAEESLGEVVAPASVLNVGNLTDGMATCNSSYVGLSFCSGKAALQQAADDGTYERLGVDDLAAFREESLGDWEGISMIQQEAKVERVGVPGLGNSFASKPSEPLAWESVDPELDIMALIDEEEGISLMQTRASSIHAAKARPDHAERRPSEPSNQGSADSLGVLSDEGSSSVGKRERDGSLVGDASPEASGAQEGLSLLQVSAQYNVKV